LVPAAAHRNVGSSDFRGEPHNMGMAGRWGTPTAAGAAERSLALAVLRASLLDLLATDDLDRITAAVHRHLRGRVNLA
jgi:hypothetical protein